MSRRPAGIVINPLHRIAGAIVLVGLAVVFVPLIVQSPPPTARRSPAPIVAPPIARPIAPPVAPPPTRVVSVRPSPASAAVAAPRPAGVPSRPKVVPQAQRAAHREAHVVLRVWYVQVASFTQGVAARRLAAHLRQAGFSVGVVRDLHAGRAALFRVQVGPYGNRRAARMAQRLLHRVWRGTTWVRRVA